MTAEVPIPVPEEDLHAYLDGELSPERQAAVAVWLAERPEDSARLQAWRDQANAIRAAYDPIEGEPLPARLSALGISAAVRTRRPLSHWLGAAVAAGLFFTAGYGTAKFVQPIPMTQQEGLAEYGLEAHAVYVGEVRHPVEVTAAEEEHLVRWLSKRLAAPLVVPNLASDGLSLIGGRLLPAGGRPCAMLMYEAASGERFTLMVTSGSAKGETAFRYQENGGYGTFYWHSGDFGYALVGPADKARLLGISRRVYDALS
jgi:anti-sigma factor RsiW